MCKNIYKKNIQKRIYKKEYTKKNIQKRIYKKEYTKINLINIINITLTGK